ncbi:hypothetical protein CFAM422_010020 [Trichoderma lentiforme]|uniref:Uncharacterized protein n=1 Tax=Trichoderma lentiforme TaxID=1567552 RepID=A0A9P4X8G1_9HYPO|nr:hypothetical protein CFAM422_010020 [Trichoderma lentiforme]
MSFEAGDTFYFVLTWNLKKTVLEYPIAGPPAGPSRAQNDSVAHGGWWSAAWSDWLPNSRNLRQFEEAVDGFWPRHGLESCIELSRAREERLAGPIKGRDGTNHERRVTTRRDGGNKQAMGKTG